jgi:alkyl sulfatase BDS1-like metallo-beta-lactamase superfamily hydrolase
MGTPPKPATEHTRAANAPVDLGFDDADFERASRGLVAQLPDGKVTSPFGVVWDMHRYDFIERGSQNPETVDPSLWRQAQLNSIHGLFEVGEGIWQARGYDISNVTFIEGDRGWIVIDPLTVEPTAKACLDLANSTLGERPVVAVIYTHSHTDHFGGVLGVTTRDDVDAGRCQVIAPEHFLREAVGENVIAGYAMTRRAAYQFGPMLPAGPRQHVDCGLGKAIPFYRPDLVAPTTDITHTGQELDVDGVRIVFQMTPEAEAPAEMNFYFPDRRWLCMAENCTHNMHNLVPIRGALVRDARRWSRYIGEAIELWGHDSELMFASHHWPRWGGDDVRRYLRLQRDLYAWMHDQTMRRANRGMVATEIADDLEVPPELRAESHTVGYYGHLVHNSKAVYQRYLSWYDGNPAHLWQLPPTEAGARYVELAGGADAAVTHARTKFAEGDYRWVAELLNHVVFAHPDHHEARELQADTLEQLGYQSESATFRNAYLTGAQELRNGTLPSTPITETGYLEGITVDQLFDAMAVRLAAEDVGGIELRLNFTFPELDERWLLGLEHRALHYVSGRHDDDADASVVVTKHLLVELVSMRRTVAEAVDAGDLRVDGDVAALTTIIDHLEVFMSNFNIVEP